MNKLQTTLTRHPQLIRVILAMTLVGAAFLLGLVAFRTTRTLVSGNLLTLSADLPSIISLSQTPELNAAGTPLPRQADNPTIPDLMPTLTPWDGAGRVTILILGLDYRDWEAGEKYSRSDTMILLTLDPQAKTAGILSIPRDMWVPIPGFKHGKINTAYYLGDAFQLPGGGPGLAVKTVEQFLGVPVNYYAQIDFEAFVRFIDEIGGVKINIPEKIAIDLVGSGAKTKKTLQPGLQVLPGAWALAYARARYTEGGDFDRAARQQQVIMALRDKILSAEMLPILITKAPTLYKELAAGIHTNLGLDQAVQLALLAQGVSGQNIQKGVIGKEYTIFGWSPDKLSILIPIPDKIHLLRDQIFASSGSLSPATSGNTEERMKTEAARIAIYNGSNDPELGDSTASYLTNLGANVTQVAIADKRYPSTALVDHTGSPFALRYLSDLMKISEARIVIQFDPASPVDLEIYLGNDWAASNSLP